jgi:hypothetical protein
VFYDIVKINTNQNYFGLFNTIARNVFIKNSSFTKLAYVIKNIFKHSLLTVKKVVVNIASIHLSLLVNISRY